MLCASCYKKIPEGEEVQRGGSSVHWQAGYWGGGGGKSGVFCRQCAKKEDKREKRLWIVFISIFIFVFLVILFSTIFVMFWKEK